MGRCRHRGAGILPVRPHRLLASPLWLKLGDVAAQPVTQTVVVPDSGAPEHSTRLYLLVTPAVP